MTFSQATEAIESHEFAARLNLASDLKSFFMAARSERAVLDLWSSLDSEENCKKVLWRIIEISECKTDIRYENPWDTALAIYLWLLASKNSEIKDLAIHTVEDRAKRCWWAIQVAQRSSTRDGVRAGAEAGHQIQTTNFSDTKLVALRSDANEEVLTGGFMRQGPDIVITDHVDRGSENPHVSEQRSGQALGYSVTSTHAG